MIIFHDGSRMIYDDGIKRTIEEMHQEQDVEEIFFLDYDKTIYPPPYGYDPGRYRCAAFFGKIYGDTSEEVVKNLVYVNWCPKHGGKPLLFTSVTGAAEALQRVSDELDHESHRSHYWRWSYPRAHEYDEIKYYNTFNMKVVEIFERHGFIWGGRWYHFDTMHFEYRPEMNMPEYMISVESSKTITAERPDPELEQEFYYRVFKEHKTSAAEDMHDE